MITPVSIQIENSMATELPNQLYNMMSSMKFTIDKNLETYSIGRFNIPELRNIGPHTTPVDHITRMTRRVIHSYITNLNNIH